MRLAALLFLAGCCLAQPAPAFEVASIKLNPDGPETSFSYDISPSGTFSTRNVTLWTLLRFARGLRDLQISGAPPWAKTQGFDIQAQPAGLIPRDQVLLMLQTLLQDRFQLKAHNEIRQVPAYALTVASGGARLTPASGEEARTLRIGNINSASITVASLASMLEFDLGRPVVDRTGLTGSFTIHLEWAPEKDLAAGSPLPSSFTAVQEQLGLKLESTRAPVETLVIDSVQMPSAN